MTFNHAYAVASASDAYAEEAKASYEGATDDRIDRDILEIENIARLVVGLAKNVPILIGRTEFATVPAPKYALSAMLIDALEHEMTPAAHDVLKACVEKMESEK